jgi:hypothetical protein
LSTGERVLLGRLDAVEAVAVERVERPHAELLADGDRAVDAGPELLGPAGPGDQPAVAGRHVPGREVEPDQPYTGVPDRGDEVGHRLVGGHRPVERPPELDRVEPAALAAAGRSGQRQLGEQISS